MDSGRQPLRLAIAGATGLVGRELLAIIEHDSSLPVGFGLFASAESAGTTIAFGGQSFPMQDLAHCRFEDYDAVFFCVGDELSARYVPAAVAAGCLVIDKSNAFRLQPGVPLVVAGVNDAALAGPDRLVANPNCSTIILTHALAPLHHAFGIERAWVATYQSVSGAGRGTVESLLAGETHHPWQGELPERPTLDSAQYAYNVIPAIGRIDDTGRCGEESKLIHETRKVLGEPGLPLIAHAVRVPVVVGHSMAVTVELQRPATEEQVLAHWGAAPDLRWLGDGLPSPLSAMHHPQVELGRLRPEPDLRNSWSFFASGDNLTLGAALNGWRILKLLVARERAIGARALGAS